MDVAATPHRTTTSAFPLKYFVFAFAFAWFFWGLQLLVVRDVIPALPALTVIGAFGPMVAAAVLTARRNSEDAGNEATRKPAGREREA